jgi:quercetin dioxygenase-like cupin family protein
MNSVSAISAETTEASHLWFGNTRVAIRVASRQGADGISVIEHWMPYGEAPPLHIHRNEDEVFYVITGRMRFRIGERTLVASAGETLLAPKGIPHHFRVESPEGAHCLTVTRGADFESMVRTVSRQSGADWLPPLVTPDAATVGSLAAACAANGIDIIGVPLR